MIFLEVLRSENKTNIAYLTRLFLEFLSLPSLDQEDVKKKESVRNVSPET